MNTVYVGWYLKDLISDEVWEIVAEMRGENHVLLALGDIKKSADVRWFKLDDVNKLIEVDNFKYFRTLKETQENKMSTVKNKDNSSNYKLSLCPHCYCMTYSTYGKCGKCKNNKSLYEKL